jgi:flagellar hook assembly protein FlgD
LSSPVVTPNNDGANDQVVIQYDLINLDETGGSTAMLELYTLDGRLVTVLSKQAASSGRLPFTWDGTDGSGIALPPGVYLLRLRVDTDNDTSTALRAISVAY